MHIKSSSRFLNNVIVADNCRIGKNTVLDNVIVWSDVVIEDNIKLKNVVIADNSHVKSSIVNEKWEIIPPNKVVDYSLAEKMY